MDLTALVSVQLIRLPLCHVKLALALLLYTALRRADVVRLGPANLREGRLRFTYSKNGSQMDIPVRRRRPR